MIADLNVHRDGDWQFHTAKARIDTIVNQARTMLWHRKFLLPIQNSVLLSLDTTLSPSPLINNMIVLRRGNMTFRGCRQQGNGARKKNVWWVPFRSFY